MPTLARRTRVIFASLGGTERHSTARLPPELPLDHRVGKRPRVSYPLPSAPSSESLAPASLHEGRSGGRIVGRRRTWLTSTAVIGALTLAALGAGAAQAQVTLPNGPAPLPPGPPESTFQGGDGNQDNAPPLVDWQGLQDTDRVVHNPDGDLQFALGSKEDNPGGWRLIGEGEGVDGVNPAKDNIFDAWSAVDQPGARTFLYLGFTRERALGTTTIAFELNQDARTWDNDDNPATPRIPCRRTGDVLIVYDAHGNDIKVEVELERWVTETTDPSTGCATKGHLDLLPAPEPPQTAADSGQGAVNPDPITSRLPGHFPIGAEIPEPRLFGEAALNLTALFEAAKLDSCFSYGSIWMHSRSSRPVTSAMQDYLAPKPLALNTCAAAGTKFSDLDANGKRDIGEPGLPGFVIWADYDNDGVLDEKEPFTVSDSQGRYVLKEIQPTWWDLQAAGDAARPGRDRLDVLVPERRHRRRLRQRTRWALRLRVGTDRRRQDPVRAGQRLRKLAPGTADGREATLARG